MSVPAWKSNEILAKLQDPVYAREFGEEYARTAFGLLLAKARTARNMTQSDLAERLGVKQSYIAKLESGEANPTVGKIGQIMGILQLRLAVEAEEWATDEVGMPIVVQPWRRHKR